MKTKFIILILLTFLGESSSFSQNIPSKFSKNEAFTFGEKLNYKFKYTLYINIPVGEITMEVKPEPKILRGQKHFHLYGKGTTYRFYDLFFKVRDYYESYVDVKTFLPSASLRIIHEGDYNSSEYYIFDHKNNLVTNNKKEKIKSGEFTQEVLSAIYLARTFDYTKCKPGDSFMVNIFIDDSLYFAGVKYMGKTTVKTKNGSYKCLILKPILIVDRVFKSDEDMTLWVTDDKNKIPVRIYTGISVGAINVELVSYSGIKNPLTSKIK
ncbi:DUF3108 domain-containing protein [Bacteroidota bacterium]